MTDPQATVNPSPPASDAAPADPSTAPEPQWPAALAFWTAPWLPATTARRTQRTHLLSAFGAHAVAAVLTFVLIMMMSEVIAHRDVFAWADEIRPAMAVRGSGPVLLKLAIVTGIIVLFVEGCSLTLAFLLMPLGARDERIRDSFRAALRRVWLHSGHALPVVLLAGGLIVACGLSRSEYYRRSNTFRFSRPRPKAPIAPSPPVTARAMADYNAALQTYSRQMNEWNAAYEKVWAEQRKPEPFLSRYQEHVAVGVILVSGVWIVWALLRGVVTRGPVAPIRRPPMCESCGYNLTAASADGRCPECGLAIMESLDLRHRQGTDWERRREIGWLRAYWRTVRDTFAGPTVVGRQIDVLSFRDDHLRLLAIHFGIAAIVGLLGVVATFLFMLPGRDRPNAGDIILGIAPMLTAIGSLILLGWISLCAVAVAMELNWTHGRNLAHAAMRVASHHSVLLIPWAVLAVAQGVLAFKLLLSSRCMVWLMNHGVDRDIAVTMMFVGLNLPIGLWYYRTVRLGTAAARFANR